MTRRFLYKNKEGKVLATITTDTLTDADEYVRATLHKEPHELYLEILQIPRSGA